MKQLTLIKVAGVVMSLAAFGGGMANADVQVTYTADPTYFGDAYTQEFSSEEEAQNHVNSLGGGTVTSSVTVEGTDIELVKKGDKGDKGEQR